MTTASAEADFADLIEDAPVAGFVTKPQLPASAIRRLLSAP
jgi:hypothetical protein